ncbi:putative ankyrin repeat protein [Chloropicon roscoffensis]|uniref:Ankyrin repeat protein n=1 Tax=Chloropicon roscoffensis TaxID=1461544 RepID=A0AAX4PFP7_9CHLO
MAGGAEVEAANRDELLRKLPAELWSKIVDENVQQNDLFALAMTCRFFREKQKDLGKKVETNVDPWLLVELRESGEVASHTLGWFQWVCDTMEILPRFYLGNMRVEGAVYETDLVNYAAFQGSVEILRWLVEEKGWETNWETCEWAGMSGSIEVLEYLKERGYEFNVMACVRAAKGGHLEALKYLRGLDPPCPWDGAVCSWAAEGGQLEVLQWLRGQDPPCPWSWLTCSDAARGGQLEALKWARSEDPPCPWDRSTCFQAAYGGHLEVLKWARSQDPPCPWDWETCGWAAEGGQLEVLKWLRSQDPPCPWYRSGCREVASLGHPHVVEWIDQQEDHEGDVA